MKIPDKQTTTTGGPTNHHGHRWWSQYNIIIIHLIQINTKAPECAHSHFARRGRHRGGLLLRSKSDWGRLPPILLLDRFHLHLQELIPWGSDEYCDLHQHHHQHNFWRQPALGIPSHRELLLASPCEVLQSWENGSTITFWGLKILWNVLWAKKGCSWDVCEQIIISIFLSMIQKGFLPGLWTLEAKIVTVQHQGIHWLNKVICSWIEMLPRLKKGREIFPQLSGIWYLDIFLRSGGLSWHWGPGNWSSHSSCSSHSQLNEKPEYNVWYPFLSSQFYELLKINSPFK